MILPTYQCREAVIVNAVKTAVNGISACAPVDSGVPVTLNVCAGEQTIWLAFINQIKVAFCYIFGLSTDIQTDITELQADIVDLQSQIDVLETEIAQVPVWRSVANVDLINDTLVDIFTVPAGFLFLLQDFFITDVANLLTEAHLEIFQSGGAPSGMSILTLNTGTSIVTGQTEYGPRTDPPAEAAICAAGNNVQAHIKLHATGDAFTANVYVVGLLIPV